MGEVRLENFKEKDHLGDLDKDGRIIFKFIISRKEVSAFSWLRILYSRGLL
jgi:hypothetical protein